ncbi:MAG: tRNA (N(6)-L-threonylcarbamoyladenosine(37)-C(2))-methylthiotransferase MtaB [Lachnospiraceae bacterium]|nr:tRNA (N(6)-L-threonylcarbamoyladenosine(37)-C(2))-methylthiotransferase MtaB [Lachnospiraceae bacterium]
MKTIALHNLGCKVNSYEVDIMQQLLQESGYEIVQFNQKADIYVINTCSVTNMADRKSRQMLHKARKLNPEAIVVAVGCFVQADAREASRDEAIDLLIGNNRKKDIVEILEQYMETGNADLYLQEEEEVRTYLRKTLGNTTVVDVKKADFEDAKMEHTAEHTRAYIKIQDGCNRFCSYCIIPYTRGGVRSRRPELVLDEIRGLVSAGYKEFVLTGIHISSYGLDFEQKNPALSLSSLLKEINALPGVERIRIGSFEPMILQEDFVKELSRLDKLCPHFHISLQSGCDATLKRMNRRYDTGEYLSRVKLLREYFPGCAITTDVIVGFPGETEEEFAETVAFLREVSFFEMHIFKYSRRKGTRADVMEHQIPEEIKQKRSNVLLELEQEMSASYRASFMGKALSVLLEEKKTIGGTEYWIGHSREYVKVACNGKECGENQILTLVPEAFLEEDVLLGK